MLERERRERGKKREQLQEAGMGGGYARPASTRQSREAPHAAHCRPAQALESFSEMR